MLQFIYLCIIALGLFFINFVLSLSVIPIAKLVFVIIFLAGIMITLGYLLAKMFESE